MEKVWADLTAMFNTNPVGWSLALGAFGAAAVVVLDKKKLAIWGWRNIIPNMWRGMMAKKARRELVRQQATDDFISSVMERVAEGTYTHVEAIELYRDLKKCFPIADVFASPEVLKENIQKRRASGMHRAVPLPDAIIPPKARHAFDRSGPVKA